ncbi:MAG: S41 family peptidase [Rhodoplanes sp.]
MSDRDPKKNFDTLWKTFHRRYPFFELRKVDWKKQHDTYRPKITKETSDEELFDILCRMIDPLDDGHVELEARIGGKKRRFTAEKKTRFQREFTEQEIKQLFKTSEKTLVANGFGRPKRTEAGILRYGRSKSFGYLRIVELEGINKRKLIAAVDRIARDFDSLEGFIIDIRDCPGGEDSIAIMIIDRFCDRERVAFHRRTKVGPGKDDFTPLQTWYLAPQGDVQFTGPIVLLTNDSIFSGGEAFALAIRELPHVTIMADRTNGIFSYTLDKTLPNGWNYCLSYQVYYSADMVCYEGIGIPVDIELLNKKPDIDRGVDPLITIALQVLRSKNAVAMT